MINSKYYLAVFVILLISACGSGQPDRTNQYQAEQAAARAEEAERRAAAIAEKNRIAEIERQRREEEWERNRVQREAAQREEILREAQRRAEADRLERQRREQAEKDAYEEKKRREARLKTLCPLYWLARQTCASASNYEGCMNIRSGNRYSRRDDADCQAR
jgi:hypothetical protein